MNTLQAIATRKSCRAYTEDQITESEITLLLQAANAAPVGMGKYKDLKLTVIQNKEILATMDEAGAELFGQPGMHPSYGAPTLILVSGKQYEEGQAELQYANAGCIMENMALEATELGLGCVYLKGIVSAVEHKKEICNDLHLPKDYIPLAALAVGHSKEEAVEKELTTEKIAFDFIK